MMKSHWPTVSDNGNNSNSALNMVDRPYKTLKPDISLAHTVEDKVTNFFKESDTLLKVQRWRTLYYWDPPSHQWLSLNLQA